MNAEYTVEYIAKSATVLNICSKCKENFLQCDERRECETFHENWKTAFIAIDMYITFEKQK